MIDNPRGLTILKGAAEPLRGGVAADQRADAAAVERRHTRQVDDDVTVVLLEEALDAKLQVLGGPARNERLFW